jgi:hemolysin III
MDDLRELADSIKPRLRGWLHLGAFPVSVVCGIVLVWMAGPGRPRLASAVFALTAALLFGVSGLYHRGAWSPRVDRVLRRLDHASIFLIIAGTYTPFALLLLHGGRGELLLWIIWLGALAGVAFRVLWAGAPRWLSTTVYLALGWTVVFFLPDFWRSGAIATLVLLAAGGVLYSLGGLVYGLKRPNPSPRWFGFHEVFHSFTLVAWALHYVAVSMTAYT